MKRNNLFWGTVLLLIGGLLLLDNLGVFYFLRVSIWQLIWPTAVILLGAWLLWGATLGKPHLETEDLSIPLENAPQGHVKIEHGAGQIRLDGNAPSAYLMSGTFEGGIEYRLKTGDNNTLDLKLQTPPQVYGPWNWGYTRREWNLSLTPEIPLTLTVQSGASDTRLDLTELQITELKVNTGASATQVTLPAHIPYTRAAFEGGAASVNIRVPEGVAARVQTEGALYNANIDTERFPRQGNIYQSRDYETAERKADIIIKMGVGSAEVK
ncbi:MAG: hypothetical protein JXA33_25415 [Anaerolineae bacterium]|nr:hypothetical protein [Anaerolineae bacterium]